MADDQNGLSEGIRSSKGDPRVLLVMNALLSVLFAWMVVAGLSFLGFIEYSLLNIATVAIVVFAATYLVLNL